MVETALRRPADRSLPYSSRDLPLTGTLHIQLYIELAWVVPSPRSLDNHPSEAIASAVAPEAERDMRGQRLPVWSSSSAICTNERSTRSAPACTAAVSVSP